MWHRVTCSLQVFFGMSHQRSLHGGLEGMGTGFHAASIISIYDATRFLNQALSMSCIKTYNQVLGSLEGATRSMTHPLG